MPWLRSSSSGLVLAVVSLLAACGGSADPDVALPYREVEQGTLVRGDVPAPAPERAVLRVTPALHPNDEDALVVDLATLEQTRLVQLEVFEPFLGRRVSFEGVPLRDVLDLAGVAEGYTTLHTVALNDYEVDIPLSVLDAPGVVVATRANGLPIAVEDGGPIRIVIADAHPDAANESYWNWSLASIELR